MGGQHITFLESSSPRSHCGMEQNSKQAKKSSDRKKEQRGSEKTVTA